MFKKSNRNFRVKKAEFDSDEENVNKPNEQDKESSQVTKKPVILKEDSSSQPEIIYSKPSSTKTGVLCFNEEEEESVFKVKKTKESKRIYKELKKSNKDKEKQSKEESKIKIKKESESEILYNEGIKIKPLVKQEITKQKYLINKYKNADDEKSDDEFNQYVKESKSDDEKSSIKEDEEDEAEKLNRLREEFEILNGEDLDPVEKETDETRRSMKLMLKSGIIPDASIVHEARKKREMARQNDYIPIGADRNIKVNSNKSRIVREDDDNDLSDEEERVSLNFREKAFKERQATRDNFLAYEQGSEDEKNSDLNDEDEDEEDKWEKEQIKKGVLISQMPSSIDFKDFKKSKLMEKLFSTNLEQEEIDVEASESFNVEKLSGPEITFQSIKDLLKKKLSLYQETYRAHSNENNMTLENLNANKTDYNNLKISKPLLDEEYTYYQEMKAYLRDFIDCYDEKVPEIEKAETKWLVLMKQRAEKFSNRRQQDIKDQSYECSKKNLDPAHQRRMTDREERRSKRIRLRNEKKVSITNEIELIVYNEGFSSDDDENQSDENVFKQKRDDILNQLRQDVFTDVLEDFYKFDLIKQRFEKWKKLNPNYYKNAFISLSLPKLFAPLIRTELVDWNPLETEDINYLEKMNWFNDLISYNKQDLLKQADSQTKLDDDFLLIPLIIESIVLKKLITLAESVYDPFSSKQTKNLTSLISKLVNDYPTVNNQSSNAKTLIETLIGRIKRTFNEDVFVPLYPKQILEQKANDQSNFFYRQFWSCVKLFGNVLMWKGIFSDNVVKELALDCLLNRYMMIGLQNMETNIKTIVKIEYILKKLPSEWLQTNIESTNSMTLPQLSNLFRLIRRIADQINQDEFQSKKIDSKEFKYQIQKIRKLFISLGATDQAVSLSNAYEL